MAAESLIQRTNPGVLMASAFLAGAAATLALFAAVVSIALRYF